MRKTLGCLHAHHSNIAYINHAFAHVDLELVHFVDPGLVYRIGHDPDFPPVQANDRIRQQLQWMESCSPDAILLTCTNYIAAMDESEKQVGVPLIKLDEPFFGALCQDDRPKRLVFTNPATVEGTMRRLHAFAAGQSKTPRISVQTIPDAFELVMQGKLAEHNHLVQDWLRQPSREDASSDTWVAQLSMVDAARAVEQLTGRTVGNPLAPLIAHVTELLDLHED